MTFRFISWSDSSGSSFSKLSSESAIINSLDPEPAFTCWSGDLCDNSGYASCIPGSWKTALNAGGNLWDKTFVSRGNHDCSSDGSCSNSDNTTWQNIFNFGPETDTSSIAYKVGAIHYNVLTTDLTYSFDYQNTHFVFLDCPGADVDSLTSNQINWLNTDLTSAENRTNLQHAFLFWHGPIYDNGTGHCCDCSTYTACPIPPPALITVFNNHPIISATFHGHEHIINYAHITSSEIPGLTREFETFISGGAGAGLYDIDTDRRCDYYLGSSPTSTYYGLLTIDVNGANYTVISYRQDNGQSQLVGSFTNNYNPGCIDPSCILQII